MRKGYVAGLLWLVASVLSGCAMPARVVLPAEERAKISELTVQVIVKQDEVFAEVEPPNASRALGGGLIGAMIDASLANGRVKEVQQALVPFYAGIESIDFRRELDGVLQREFSAYPVRLGSLTTTAVDVGPAALKRMRSELRPGQALLFIAPRYALAADLRTLDLWSYAAIWTPLDDPAAGGSKSKPIHRSVAFVQSKVVGEGGKASVEQWGAQDAKLFREALQEAIAETIALAVVDPSVPAVPDGEHEFSYRLLGKSVTDYGQLIGRTEARVRLLGSDQRLYSLPRANLVEASDSSQ